MRLPVATFAALVAVFCSVSHAFAPPSAEPLLTFRPARIMHGSMMPCVSAFRDMSLRMAEDDTETPKKPMPTSGTYYDDEVDPIPASKQGISNSMKDRLRREASAGLDSNSKQTNVILYISAAIVILVLLGGQGIFF